MEDISLDIELSVADEAIARDILSRASRGIVSWQEIVDEYRGRGVSLYRLRKIILALLHTGTLIELPCRLFTTHKYMEGTPRERLRIEIASKVRELGLQKCGKPVGVVYDRVSVSISKDGSVMVSFS